jgi:hypothetical protein
VSASDDEHAYTSHFDGVRAAEIRRVNAWRRKNDRPLLSAINNDEPAGTGLALSGGGIRSAAFALGVLQALDQGLADHPSALAHGNDVPTEAFGRPTGLAKIDYLSTVSGGGYIGSSLTVAMDVLKGGFPFRAGVADKRDSDAVGHIRNYSRYLIPHGLPDVVGSLLVILRGLMINLLMVIGAILLLAGITGVFNPDQKAFKTSDFFGFEGFPYPPMIEALGSFAYTKLLLAIGLPGLVLWGLWRARRIDGGPEFKGRIFNIAQIWIFATLLCAFIELQPWAATAIFDRYGDPNAPISSWPGHVAAWLSPIMPYTASAAAVFAFANRLLGDSLKVAAGGSGLQTILRFVAAKLAVALVAITLPLLIWIVFLQVTLWTDLGFIKRPSFMFPVVELLCGRPDAGKPRIVPKVAPPIRPTWHGEQWFRPDPMSPCSKRQTSRRLIAHLFWMTGLFCLILTLLTSANANSLHRLYRDRLGKAFLFDPRPRRNSGSKQTDPGPRDRSELASLRAPNGPLHLINAAVNLQGSTALNRRGRNADFFFFSPMYCGSDSTGFVRSDIEKLERAAGPDQRRSNIHIPDVGTAMAISGAAASSNMGSRSVRGLAPTLALLNIRLGYWMDNPRKLSPDFEAGRTWWRRLSGRLQLHFVEEMFSRLDENAGKVFLTDGGHIENLGLYELLRRRCKTILVVDAEADPDLRFASFVQLQRYARIDLGCRIRLPWPIISRGAMAIDASVRAGQRPDPEVIRTIPHVAIGTIDYGNSVGRLIYVKSALSGDENDYILSYKQKHSQFPHETTGDQFFSEEQFEAYRALGFHALNGAMTGSAPVAGLAEMLRFPGRDKTHHGETSEPTAAELADAFKNLFA